MGERLGQVTEGHRSERTASPQTPPTTLVASYCIGGAVRPWLRKAGDQRTVNGHQPCEMGVTVAIAKVLSIRRVIRFILVRQALAARAPQIARETTATPRHSEAGAVALRTLGMNHGGLRPCYMSLLLK